MFGTSRLFVIAALALGLTTTLAAAQISQTCKASLAGKTLTMIVPSGPGGGYDTYGRALVGVLDAMAGTSSRVVNIAAAGGKVAITTLGNSAPDELVLLTMNSTNVLGMDMQSGTNEWSAKLQSLGVYHTEPNVLVAKPGFFLLDAKKLVAPVQADDRALFLEIIGHAIGKEVKLISGYKSSKEFEGALLRGEVDVMSSSLVTGLKASKGGDLSVKLLLSDKPNDLAPGIPHIAGNDGLAASLAKDLPAAERARRVDLANVAVALSYDVRTVFTHVNLAPELRDCLRLAVAEAIRDPAFAKTAKEQGRPVDPMDPHDADAFMAFQLKAVAKLGELNAAP